MGNYITPLTECVLRGEQVSREAMASLQLSNRQTRLKRKLIRKSGLKRIQIRKWHCRWGRVTGVLLASRPEASEGKRSTIAARHLDSSFLLVSGEL
jgi:hypothetical protein